jgi:AraC family transcriptional regulator, positive regulator of tynA and feaB
MLLQDVCGEARVETYDAWRTAYTEAWNGRMTSASGTAAPADFSGWIEFRRVRDLEFVRSDSMPFSGRPRAKSSDYIGIQVSLVHGGEQLNLRGPEHATVMASTALLWDGTLLENFELLKPGEYFNVVIPRDSIEQRVGPNFTLPTPVLKSESASMRLLESLVRSLGHEFSAMQAREFDSVRNAMIELIAGLVHEGVEAGSAAVSDAMLRTVHSWIDQNLLGSAITSSRAAAEHGISIRSLHRLFERRGESFSSVVRAKRLARALAELASTDASVTQLAMKWGYSDLSHLCRELRRVHHVTPSQYRRASRIPPRQLAG